MFEFNKSVIVGYDLSNEYAQISYYTSGDELAKTISIREGEEDYRIPPYLFKRSEVNQWFVGADAVSYSKVEEGELTGQIWERALIGEPVTVAGEQFDPLALLTLYIRRTLALLTNIVNKNDVAGIMFTVPELTKRAIEVLEVVTSSLGFKSARICFMGREESIYHYVINQPEELWKRDVVIYEYKDKTISCYNFRLNRITKPVVCFVDKTEHEIRVTDDADKDERFLEIVHETVDSHIVSCAYLLGDGFAGDWCSLSLQELCRNRRSFRGNNLYSRGACYAMKDRLAGINNEDRKIVFLGSDKLKANIGMDVIRGREKSYLALLDGGENWYDSKKRVEVILDKGNTFTITITPLDGRGARNVEIVLDGLKEHEPKKVRLRIEAVMESEDILRINATDLGFGDFEKATYQLFTHTLSLTGGGEDI